MIKSYLAPRMRLLRKAANLTQGEVAKNLNIERQTYCNYENETRTPPLDIIIAIAEFYHVSVDYLVKEYGSNEISDELICQPLSRDEETFINSFRELSAKDQSEVLQFIQFKSYLSSSRSK